MKSLTKGQKRLLIFVLGSLSALGPFSIDLYLPAFSEIASKLNTSTDSVALSLSSFFIGLAVGQVIYGPILERFGRKYPIYVGLIIYIIATFGCMLSQSVESLIIFRFFQALGSCAGLVSSRTIIRDLFETREMAKVFSMLMMVIAVSPILAPSLGGFITSFLGWRYVFGSLIVMAIIILVITILFLPNSKDPDPSYSMKIQNILRNYKEIFSDQYFIVYALLGGVSYGGLYAYLSSSPHIYMELYHVSKSQYGWIFAIISLGLIGASQVNSYILERIPTKNVIKYALFFQFLVAVLLVIFILMNYVEFISITVFIFLYLFCLGFIFPNASALSLNNLRSKAGNASALMGSVQMTLGAIASAVVSLFQGDSGMPLAMIMLISVIIALLFQFTGERVLKPIKE